MAACTLEVTLLALAAVSLIVASSDHVLDRKMHRMHPDQRRANSVRLGSACNELRSECDCRLSFPRNAWDF
eukprot:3631971-Prymnesium_polylepis.1